MGKTSEEGQGPSGAVDPMMMMIVQPSYDRGTVFLFSVGVKDFSLLWNLCDISVGKTYG